MAKLSKVKVRNDLTAKKLGITEETLAQNQAATKASLDRTKNVGPNSLTADDIRARNKQLGKPSDAGEAQALESKRLDFEQQLLHATPGQQPGELPMSSNEQQVSQSSNPTLQNSGTQAQQPATSSQAGAVALNPNEQLGQTQQITNSAEQAVQETTTGLLDVALDPIGPISRKAAKAVESSPEGSFRESFNKEMFKFLETQRFAARKAARGIVGLRILGVGIGTEREGDLKVKLGDSRRILKDNTEAMNDIVSAFKSGEISQDEALQGFVSLRDQILETESAVLAVSRDPLAFKLGDMEDDLTDFRNWRQTRLPRLQNQLIAGAVI